MFGMGIGELVVVGRHRPAGLRPGSPARDDGQSREGDAGVPEGAARTARDREGARETHASGGSEVRVIAEAARRSDRGARESGGEMNGRWSGWGSLALVAFQVAGCSLLPGGEPTLDSALRARQLMVPVAGVSPDQVPDNFRAPRSGARIHGAVDIPAPRGTPVLSADDGRVLRLQRNWRRSSARAASALPGDGAPERRAVVERRCDRPPTVLHERGTGEGQAHHDGGTKRHAKRLAHGSLEPLESFRPPRSRVRGPCVLPPIRRGSHGAHRLPRALSRCPTGSESHAPLAKTHRAVARSRLGLVGRADGGAVEAMAVDQIASLN